MALVRPTEAGGIEVLRDNIHLPKGDPAYVPWRTQLRTMSLARAMQLSNDQSYFFSVVLSSDEKTKQEIQQRFMEFISSIQKLVSDSKQEELYTINFDLLPWTR